MNATMLQTAKCGIARPGWKLAVASYLSYLGSAVPDFAGSTTTSLGLTKLTKSLLSRELSDQNAKLTRSSAR